MRLQQALYPLLSAIVEVCPSRRPRVEASSLFGYVSNRIKDALASIESRLVGAIIPCLSKVRCLDILCGAGAVLDQAGPQLVIGLTDYDLACEETLVSSALSRRPAVALIAGLDLEMQEQCKSHSAAFNRRAGRHV